MRAPSAPAPSTRSPTATSTSSAGPRGSSTRSSWRSVSTRPRAACSAPTSGWTCCARRARRFDNVVVEGFTGLLVDFCQERGTAPSSRACARCSDFDYELQMAQMNAHARRGRDPLRADQPASTPSSPRAWSRRSPRSAATSRPWCPTSCSRGCSPGSPSDGTAARAEPFWWCPARTGSVVLFCRTPKTEGLCLRSTRGRRSCSTPASSVVDPGCSAPRPSPSRPRQIWASRCSASPRDRRSTWTSGWRRSWRGCSSQARSRPG